jgi:hypothetical protein
MAPALLQIENEFKSSSMVMNFAVSIYVSLPNNRASAQLGYEY